jgi:hypothetical protein
MFFVSEKMFEDKCLLASRLQRWFNFKVTLVDIFYRFLWVFRFISNIFWSQVVSKLLRFMVWINFYINQLQSDSSQWIHKLRWQKACWIFGKRFFIQSKPGITVTFAAFCNGNSDKLWDSWFTISADKETAHSASALSERPLKFLNKSMSDQVVSKEPQKHFDEKMRPKIAG